MGLSVFAYKMEIIISHRWSQGWLSAQEVAALRTWEMQMPFTGNLLLLTLMRNLGQQWELGTTSYSPIFSSGSSLWNWPTYSWSPLWSCKVLWLISDKGGNFNLKSWPVFIPGSSNLNAISVSLSQPVSSLQVPRFYLCLLLSSLNTLRNISFLTTVSWWVLFLSDLIRNLMIFERYAMMSEYVLLSSSSGFEGQVLSPVPLPFFLRWG